jgi:hypothetical protein
LLSAILLFTQILLLKVILNFENWKSYRFLFFFLHTAEILKIGLYALIRNSRHSSYTRRISFHCSRKDCIQNRNTNIWTINRNWFLFWKSRSWKIWLWCKSRRLICRVASNSIVVRRWLCLINWVYRLKFLKTLPQFFDDHPHWFHHWAQAKPSLSAQNSIDPSSLQKCNY